MTPYELAQHLAHIPESFAVGGPQELWTDPHMQERMLAFHLDPDIDAASRDHAFIARSLDWIVDRFEVDGARRVLDLGCGPGLYANPLAEHGARVHGIDLSAVAIDAARQRATSQEATTPRATSARASFEVADYRTAPLPEHDLALLIYLDHCAMSPADRHRLLRRVRDRMRTGGHLLVDLHAPAHFATVTAGCTVEDRLMDGFWAPGPYVGVHQTVRYDAEQVALDRYVLVEPDRTRTVHVWTAHLSVDQATAEFAAAGFRVVEVLGDVAGSAYDPDAPEYAVVVTPTAATGSRWVAAARR